MSLTYFYGLLEKLVFPGFVYQHRVRRPRPNFFAVFALVCRVCFVTANRNGGQFRAYFLGACHTIRFRGDIRCTNKGVSSSPSRLLRMLLKQQRAFRALRSRSRTTQRTFLERSGCSDCSCNCSLSLLRRLSLQVILKWLCLPRCGFRVGQGTQSTKVTLLVFRRGS